MADPKTDDESEAIRQAGSAPGDGNQSTRPANWPGLPPPASDEKRLADDAGDDDDLPQVTKEQEELASEVAAERGAD